MEGQGGQPGCRDRGRKPLAVVLAETPDGQPLLVQGIYEEGRVLAFAGDSTWHWWMEREEPAEHKRFWRQVVLWLAKIDAPSDGSVWVKLDPRRFAPGSRVEFTAGIDSSSGDVAADVQFSANVKRPDGSLQTVRMVRQGEGVRGSILDTRQAGDYVIEVEAAGGDQPTGAARARFLVFDQDLELDNPAADPALMATMAKMTGGKKLAPEQLAGLLRQLQEESHDLEVTTEEKQTLWDKWPFFLFFVALLGTEWFLRKKWGQRKSVSPDDRRAARLQVFDGGLEILHRQRDTVNALSSTLQRAPDGGLRAERLDKLKEEAIREAKDRDLTDCWVLGRVAQLQAKRAIAFDRFPTVFYADHHVIDTDDCHRTAPLVDVCDSVAGLSYINRHTAAACGPSQQQMRSICKACP